LIVDLELEYGGPVRDYCGTCTACMDACPTDAIPETYVVDGSRCISYFTIVLKDEIPSDMKGKIGDLVFGCDFCQDVCPWNRFAGPHREPAFTPNPLLQSPSSEWKDMTEEVFRTAFRNSPLKRTGFKGLMRNLKFVRAD